MTAAISTESKRTRVPKPSVVEGRETGIVDFFLFLFFSLILLFGQKMWTLFLGVCFWGKEVAVCTTDNNNALARVFCGTSANSGVDLTPRT